MADYPQNEIEKIPNIVNQLEIFSVYDIKNYSIQELVYELQKRININIVEMNRFEDVINRSITLLWDRMAWLTGEGLETVVGDKLDQMLQEGVLADIINNQVIPIVNEIKADLETVKLKVEVNKTNVETLQQNVAGINQDIVQLRAKDVALDNEIELVKNSVTSETNRVLQTAKEYTDTEVGKVNTKLTTEVKRLDDKIDSGGVASSSSLVSLERKVTGVKGIAHRGLSSLAPENSVPAFKLAGKRGFNICETDILKTSDGVFVCSHDDELSSMSTGSGRISTSTWNQVYNLTLDKGNYIHHYPNQKYCRLQDYLNICREFSMTPMPEIKYEMTESDVDLFLTVTRKFVPDGGIIVISANKTTLQRLRAKTKEMQLAYVSFYSASDVTFVQSLGANTHLSCDYKSLSGGVVQDCHSLNIDVYAWTINDWTNYGNMVTAGVDGVATDSLELANPTQMRIGDVTRLGFGDTAYQSISTVMNLAGTRTFSYSPTSILVGGHNSGLGNTHFDLAWNFDRKDRAVALQKIYVPQESQAVSVIYDSSKYKMTLATFDKDDRYNGGVGWLNGSGSYFLPSSTCYFVLYFGKLQDGQVFTADDITEMLNASVTFNAGSSIYRLENYSPKNIISAGGSVGRKIYECYPTSDGTRLVSMNPIPVHGKRLMSGLFDSTKYKLTMHLFNSDDIMMNDLGWFTGDVSIPVGAKYGFIYMAKQDGTAFNSTDDKNLLSCGVKISGDY